MKSKKGALVYNWTLTLMIIFILGWAYLQFYSKYTKNEPLGFKQLKLFNIYAQGESALFYIDQSAKYSLQQAVYDLAENGGISEVEEIGTDDTFAFYDCGRFNDAYVWFQISKDADGNYLEKNCFDEKQAPEYLSYLFDENLNKYLENYPHNIPTSNYYYEFKNNLEVIGIAKEPLKFDIEGKVIRVTDKEIGNEFYRGGRLSGGGASRKGVFKEGTKDLVDFTGLEKAELGEEIIDIKGLCPKGRKCILTREAFDSLLRAQKRAKQKGVSLEIRDAYRSLQQQKDFWEGKTPERYKQRYPKEEDRDDYVCNPYKDNVEEKCTHLSGRAVDVRLQGRAMNINDWKLLYQIMTTTKNAENQPAWVKYRTEPWHFECCETERYARAIEQGVTELV